MRLAAKGRWTAMPPARRAGLVLAFVSTFAVAQAAAAENASANFTQFCPVAGYALLISGNNRCVSGRFYGLQQVQATTTNGAGVDHCAIAKQYSDGSGANVIAPNCTTAEVATTAYVSARSGYATIINRSASAHYFHGAAVYQ